MDNEVGISENPYIELEDALNRNDYSRFLEIINRYENTADELDVDYRLPNGDTLLARAVKLKYRLITIFLLKNNADLSERDANGDTVFSLFKRFLFGADRHTPRELYLGELGVLPPVESQELVSETTEKTVDDKIGTENNLGTRNIFNL